MSTLASTLTPSSFSHPQSLTAQRPFDSSSPSSSSLLPLANSHEQLNVMSTPLSHRNTDSLLTPKYTSRHRRSSGSPYSTASSDSNSDDDEDNEVPPTPGDGGFDSLQHAHQVKLASPTPVRSAVRGVELSRFFKEDHNDQVFKPTRPADQLLNGNAKSFYPSFGDFLPAVKQQQQKQAEQTKVAFWSTSSSTADNKENSVDQLAATTSGLSLGGYEHDTKPALNPFAHLSSPETDSFTFFPTPGFRSADDSSSNSTKPTSTSSSLRSPKPQRPALFVAPEAYVENRLPREPVYHRQHQSVTLPGFPATPPRTPVRSSYHRPTTSASLAHHGQQHLQQQQYAVPAAYFSTPTSLPPTPPSSYIPFPASPYYASHGGSPLVPIPVAVSPAPAEVAPPTPTASQAVPYPLSPADTDRIAKLHNGRIPTVQQLAPPDVVPGACQQPIVNTGNQGPMVVQAGDWRCGVCTFVNWRRRKICLRCFPYANDIGNILTIQSQRAATLAGAGAGPSSTAMRTTSSAPPLSAHTPTFHVHPAAPPYVSSSTSMASSDGVPSAHVAAAAMARSATYPPSRGYGSLALLEQQGQQQSQQQQYRYASTPPATVGRQYVPYTVINPYSSAYSPSRSNGSPMPSPTSMRFPQQQQQQQVSRPSPLQHPRRQEAEQPAPSSLPPFIWNDECTLGPQSRFSDSSSSAASAGEHAARLMARKAAAAAVAREGGGGKKEGEEGVRMFPSFALAGVEWVGGGLGAPLELETPVGGGGDDGWAPWKIEGGGGGGYVAPGPGPGAEPVLAEL
ncbi:hypothetical protein JCM8097_006836 [Rhodosporidiobolus ruineniae]